MFGMQQQQQSEARKEHASCLMATKHEENVRTFDLKLSNKHAGSAAQSINKLWPGARVHGQACTSLQSRIAWHAGSADHGVSRPSSAAAW